MIERILLRTLEQHGLTVIPTEGEPLPVLHEAVKEVVGEEKDVGTIANVIKKGYMLNGKVIRPAQVQSHVLNKTNFEGRHCQGEGYSSSHRRKIRIIDT